MTKLAIRLRAALLATALVAAPLVGQTHDFERHSLSLSPSRADAVGFDAQRLQRLDAAMKKAVDEGRVAGIQTVLVRHGKAVHAQTYGKANLESGKTLQDDAIYRIYSMSKPITGVAMMILYEEGKWSLDDPVTKYLPELKDLKVYAGEKDGKPVLVPAKRPPTMRELMSHTAGFGYGLGDQHPVDKQYRADKVFEATSMDDLAARVGKIPLIHQPGERWNYSIAVDLQGAIVERLSGQKFGDFLQQRLFGPLKMTDTAFQTGPAKASRLSAVYAMNPKTRRLEEAKGFADNQLPDYIAPPNAEFGGMGLVSTAADYARFCQMLLNGGELDGARILSPASVELMGTNVIPDAARVGTDGKAASGFNEHVGFGLDFMVVENPRAAGSMVGKGAMSWGGAAGTWFWVDPKNDLFFVGMIQRFGPAGGEDLRALSQTLTYSALVDPEK